MKIHASGFDVDMNAMLNQINSHNVHGFYNQTKSDAKKHIDDITKQINEAIKKGKANTNDMVSKMDQQIANYRQANEKMWNNAMPPQVNKAFNMQLINTPRNTDYYYPTGEFPSSAEPGDVCWQSDDWDNIGSNNVDAKMYEYYSGAGWQPVKTQTQITGVNINGASIHGGMISGATFRSGQQGMNGSPFWVNRNGTVYAQNFIADLEHSSSKDGREVNNCTYQGYHNFGNNYGPDGGFSLSNGLLSEKAQVTQKTGTPIWSDHPTIVNGATYLEPGYLKLRYARDDDNTNFVRTDLRAGMLEIAGNAWNQNKDIRIGYWNTTGPQIALGSWNIQEHNANLSLTGGIGNIDIHQPLRAYGGARISSLEVTGGFSVDGKTLADQSDINNLDGKINTNASHIDTNNTHIQNHGTILAGNGATDSPQNIINGISNSKSHANQLEDLYNQLSQIVTIQEDGSEAYIEDATSFFVGPKDRYQAAIFSSGEIMANYLLLSGANVSYGDRSNTLWVNGDSLAKVKWCNSKFSTRGSRLSIKRDIHDVNSHDALTEVLNTDIKAWNYKKDDPNTKTHYGPIIDDINDKSHEKYYTPKAFITNEDKPKIDVYDSVAYLFLSIQELQKQNSELSQRVAKLELERK